MKNILQLIVSCIVLFGILFIVVAFTIDFSHFLRVSNAKTDADREKECKWYEMRTLREIPVVCYTIFKKYENSSNEY